MSKKKKKNPNSKRDKPGLYLNANIIYSEAIYILKNRPSSKTTHKGTLFKLKSQFYLLTSILTRMEVIQNLHIRRSLTIKQARQIYRSILEDYEIAEITSIEKYISLSNELFEKIATSNLDFKDSLHISLAKKLKLKLCTHDDKMKRNFSQQEDKKKFYDEVYKPQELIKPKK